MSGDVILIRVSFYFDAPNFFSNRLCLYPSCLPPCVDPQVGGEDVRGWSADKVRDQLRGEVGQQALVISSCEEVGQQALEISSCEEVGQPALVISSSAPSQSTPFPLSLSVVHLLRLFRC